MKVSSTELPPRQVSLAIEVEQERLDHAMDDAFRRLAGRVDVPGFRRGKAPRSMVERMIGRERIVEEALDRLVPEVVTEAIEQEKVEPYTRPRVESIEFDPLRLKAVVGLAPKVELGDYKDGLQVPPEEAKVEDEQIKSTRSSNGCATRMPSGRPSNGQSSWATPLAWICGRTSKTRKSRYWTARTRSMSSIPREPSRRLASPSSWSG